MFCADCGKVLEENAKFCESCGAKVEIEGTEVMTDTVEEAVETPPVVPVSPEKPVEPVVAPKAEKKLQPERRPEPAPEPVRVREVSLTKPLGIFTYIWMLILMMIPLVNIIMVFVWAFGSHKNVNKKNYAWAVIILSVIFIAASVFGFIQFGLNFDEIIDWLTESIESY